MTFHTWQTMKVGAEGEDVKHLQQLLAGANAMAMTPIRPGQRRHGGDGRSCATRSTTSAITRGISRLGGQRPAVPGRHRVPRVRQTASGYKTKMAARQQDVPDRRRHPLAARGTINGRPYQGSHNHPDRTTTCTTGRAATRSTSTPRSARPSRCRGRDDRLADRLAPQHRRTSRAATHLTSTDNEWYYAHLSQISAR
jgi:hypothetical protein